MQYVFGEYTLDTQCYELHSAAGVVSLDRQGFTMLVYLVQHRDRVVLRQELFDRLWPDRFVSDASLEHCIAVVRRAVGDSGRSQRVIQTVHGRGYRFVAPVEERLDASPGIQATPLSPYVPEARPLQAPAVMVSPAVSASSLPVSSPLSAERLRHPLAAGERLLVTVLCGTLANTTMLADRLGFAVLQRLVQTFRTLVQDCVQRYEGTSQPLGEEGFLALFGVLVVREDHAWCAVQAALELQQRLRQEPAVHKILPTLIARLGVHTGWMVVGSGSDEPSRSVVVGGDTIQGAIRLQALADPGSLLVSDPTLRLVRGTVHNATYGLVRVPGRTEPLMAYTVQDMEAPTTLRMWSPFVGRQRELAVLDDLLDRTLASQGQVVGLIGEPGMGKSRLLAEFRKRLADRSVTYLEGHCRSYGHVLPYGPIGELLRHQCGLSATSNLDVVAFQVHQLLQAVGLSPENNAPYLVQLLGSHAITEPLAQLPPEAIKERTFATLRQVHLQSSQQQPLLLVVENLHWIDPTSEAYLASLVEQLAGAPLLLLTTYRPGYRPLWMDKSYATQLPLPRLTREESVIVVCAVLPPEQHVEALVQRILARAEGNPLFLEELAHAVREQNGLTPAIPVPETIQAVLAARIDRLSPEAKHLLHTAAVIGTKVPVSLLEALAELPKAVLHSSLAHLQAAEFLYETSLVSERAYTFKHALTQEVAYGSLLQERRRLLHVRIVDVLEAVAFDCLAEQVERLAHHAFQGEVWDKAVIYYRQAGAKALARSALHEAVASFEQALVALQHLPDSRTTLEQAIDLRFDLRHALLPLGKFARTLDYLRQAESLAEALGDQCRLGQLAGYMASCLGYVGDPDGCLASARRALAIATALGDIGRQIAATSSLGDVYWLLSDYRHAAEAFSRNVELLRGAPLQERFGTAAIQAVYSRAHLARCLAELGAFAEGRVHAEDTLRLGEAFEHPYTLAQACAAVGLFYMRQGALPQAVQVFERGLALSETLHLLPAIRMLNGRLGAAYALSGRVPEALPLLERALEQTVAMRQSINYAPFAVWLGEGYILAGRLAKAKQLGQQALKAAQTGKQQGHQAYALRLLGEIAAHGDLPDVALAATSYRQALDLAEKLGMRPLQAHCHCGLGMLYTKIGQREQARVALSTAIEQYCAMEMTFWLPQAEAALVQVA